MIPYQVDNADEFCQTKVSIVMPTPEARHDKASILNFNNTLAQARQVQEGFTQLSEDNSRLPAEAKEVIDNVRLGLAPLVPIIRDVLLYAEELGFKER